MASKIRNIELLQNIFGHQTQHILKKLEDDNVNLKNRSSNFVIKLANTIFNYIDFIYFGDVSVIKNKSIEQIEIEYNEWVKLNKDNNYSFTELKNENIIFDYRVNKVGYYWVDLKSHHSSDMMFNMNNCGRVGINQNLIILKNQKKDEQINMCVAIVITNDNYITQIKGVSNTKPLKFYNYIFNFLINYEPINGFKRVFKPEDDFTIFDLKKEDYELLKTKKPHLFNKFI
jgi:hypothetical protein